ncbi:MAG: hypothetical protein HND57_04905 [Planctomycetes bacterium]|nr:hypothetical protein [Planctomycetota bacterium]
MRSDPVRAATADVRCPIDDDPIIPTQGPHGPHNALHRLIRPVVVYISATRADDYVEAGCS